MKVVLVTGGRAYRDRHRVWETLDAEHPDLVIQGGAFTRFMGVTVGADHFAYEWARDHDVPYLTAPYRRVNGKAGGPIRNEWMVKQMQMYRDLDAPYGPNETLVLAFPGGTGTAGTVQLARDAGIPVRMIDDDETD